MIEDERPVRPGGGLPAGTERRPGDGAGRHERAWDRKVAALAGEALDAASLGEHDARLGRALSGVHLQAAGRPRGEARVGGPGRSHARGHAADLEGARAVRRGARLHGPEEPLAGTHDGHGGAGDRDAVRVHHGPADGTTAGHLDPPHVRGGPRRNPQVRDYGRAPLGGRDLAGRSRRPRGPPP